MVYIFRYFRLYLQRSIKKNEEEGRSGTTGTGVSQKDLQRGAKRTKNVISKERRAMQAGSGGHIGKVEKQLGLNLQVGGERLKLQGLRSANVKWISFETCLVQSSGY